MPKYFHPSVCWKGVVLICVGEAGRLYANARGIRVDQSAHVRLDAKAKLIGRDITSLTPGSCWGALTKEDWKQSGEEGGCQEGPRWDPLCQQVPDHLTAPVFELREQVAGARSTLDWPIGDTTRQRSSTPNKHRGSTTQRPSSFHQCTAVYSFKSTRDNLQSRCCDRHTLTNSKRTRRKQQNCTHEDICSCLMSFIMWLSPLQC